MRVRESGMPPEDVWNSFFAPEKTLDALLLDESHHDAVEFGCGYGTFTLPAAQRVSGKVIALDLDPAMLEATMNKVKAAGLDNIDCRLRDFVADGSGIPDGGVDYAMLFNILHLEEPVSLLREAWRNLAPGGLLGVTHWIYDENAPRGPPLDIRPKSEQCLGWALEAGFSLLGEIIELPPYHYGLVLKR